MKKKIVIIIFIILIFILIFTIGSAIIENARAWKIEITNEYINVRENHSVYDLQIDTVYQGEKYKVLDIYLDNPNYIWYKIKVGYNEGWVASDRNEPYVKEYNSPYALEENPDIVDYASPILKFYDDTYKTKSIDTITLDHLEIIDDSDYEVTYEIYKEEEPIDMPGPQYWIQYTVIDSFGNKTVKVQRIEFEIAPLDDQVLDFSELDYQ